MATHHPLSDTLATTPPTPLVCPARILINFHTPPLHVPRVPTPPIAFPPLSSRLQAQRALLCMDARLPASLHAHHPGSQPPILHHSSRRLHPQWRARHHSRWGPCCNAKLRHAALEGSEVGRVGGGERVRSLAHQDGACIALLAACVPQT